jgi:hypothetical protein
MININAKSSNAVLRETQELFQSHGMSIIGEGYKEIASNPSLFEEYIDSLTQGVDANHVETMKQLMRNTNTNILTESVAGIAPIASLSMPVIRKLWPRFALKEAVKEEVAKTPRFVISYTKPYMFRGKEDGTEERVYLPKGLKNDQGGLTSELGKQKCVRTITLGTEAVEVNFADKDFVPSTGNTGSAYVKTTGSAVKVQPLDRDFYIQSVGGTEVHAVLDINNTVIYDIPEGGTILVRVDLVNAKANVVGFGLAEGGVEVVLVAPMSTEYNEATWSVSFDIGREDVQIPTGEHINAPLPLEALQDMMALYNIDGTKETTDLMTNVVAMQLDKDVLAFLRKSFLEQPGHIYTDHPEYSEYTISFDVRPAAGYAGGPKEWREQLKPQIDFLAQKIKNETYLNSGMFVIVANPLDAMLISNIDWQFRGGQGANVDGVDIDYSVGTYVGANSYRIIASVNVQPGIMWLVFLPSNEKQMTYKYYPYSFAVEHGYIDPNRSRVPSIMVTKRHTFKQFLPAIGCINVINNDGAAQFAPYIQTKAWAASDFAETETYPGIVG